MTNYSVIITSPGYPHSYASNLNVTWTIHTDPQHHIEIDFLYLDLFSMETFIDHFSYDYINVKTGKDSYIIVYFSAAELHQRPIHYIKYINIPISRTYMCSFINYF